MKYSDYKKIVAVLFIAIGISCQEEITIDLNDQRNQRLVVEGRLTNEIKNHTVRLSRTLSYFDSQQAPAVTNADVYILEEGTGTHYDLTLSNDTFGYYQTGLIRGKVGETYTLVVLDGSDEYEATAYLDTVAQMDSINYIYEYMESTWYSQGYYIIRMSAYEPAPVGNIYMFYLYINDSLYNDALSETPYANDIFFNDSYLPNIELAYIPQEAITHDTNTFKVLMLSISEEEFNYNNTFLQESYNGGSIFSGPPANIPSNLKSTSGGLDGLGFFGASSVSVKEMMLYKEHNDSTNNSDYEPSK
jgi:hypothetical protein